jgi:hypothetical protein
VLVGRVCAESLVRAFREDDDEERKRSKEAGRSEGGGFPKVQSRVISEKDCELHPQRERERSKADEKMRSNIAKRAIGTGQKGGEYKQPMQ